MGNWSLFCDVQTALFVVITTSKNNNIRHKAAGDARPAPQVLADDVDAHVTPPLHNRGAYTLLAQAVPLVGTNQSNSESPVPDTGQRS